MKETNSNGHQMISLKLRAPVSDEEKARLSRLLEAKISKSGKIRLLLYLENYPARDSAESLFEDIEFIKLHAEAIERMAVVGERAWQETWIGLFSLFGGVEIAYFDYSDKEKAAIWLAE